MYKNLHIEKVFNDPENKFMVYADIHQTVRLVKDKEVIDEGEIIHENKPIAGFLIESSAKRFIQMEEEKNAQKEAQRIKDAE